jgi:predicted small lipoprotein YifL
MNVKRGFALAALAGALAACGGQTGPQPIATINPNIATVSQPSVAFEAEVKAVGPVTFIEFYAEW